MKHLLLVALLVVPAVALAAKKPVPLSAASGALLANKLVVVTRHEKPSFYAMTAGKAGFGLFGVAAMYSAGNKIVQDNGIVDPADIIERELVPALAKHYNFTVKAGSAPLIKPDKPKEIAKTQTEGDYILDLKSQAWNFAYYATDWNNYWTGYGAHVQLIERASGKVLSDMFCGANNQKHAAPPTRDALLANGAQLLKDAETSHGWACAQVFAKQQFLLPDGAIAATPPEFLDPLATYAARSGGASAPASSAVATPAAGPMPGAAPVPATN